MTFLLSALMSILSSFWLKPWAKLTHFAQCELCFAPSGTAGFLCDDCLATLPYAKFSCQRCALPLQTQGLCAHCLLNPPAMDATFCSYLYQPPISHWLLGFKDRHQFSALARLQWLMLERQPNFMPDAVTYVPSTAWHLLKRGFNPAEYLAHHIAKAMQLPIIDHALVRRGGRDQRLLSRQARLLNSKHSLRAGQQNLQGQHLLLVEDVITTGATAQRSAELLKAQGAATVSVWALARAYSETRKKQASPIKTRVYQDKQDKA